MKRIRRYYCAKWRRYRRGKWGKWTVDHGNTFRRKREAIQWCKYLIEESRRAGSAFLSPLQVRLVLCTEHREEKVLEALGET